MNRRPFLLGFLTLLAGIGLYRFRSRIFAHLLRLPPPRHKVVVERNLPIPMRDGIILRADHYAPKSAGSFPTLLVRSIYGRGTDIGPLGAGLGFPYARFAERGYHVVVQTTRGQFDSGGEFEPVFHETEDGLDTIAWIEEQPWFNGNLGMWGQSYLGYTQWAVAAKAPPSLKAVLPAVITANMYELFYTHGAPNLEISLRWMMILAGLRALSPRGKLSHLDRLSPSRQDRLLEQAAREPLHQADRRLIGETARFFQDGLQHPHPDDTYWQPLQLRASLHKVLASTFLIGGWYDMCLGGLLQDYAALRAAGHTPFLTIGPWHHMEFGYTLDALRDGLDWYESRLKGNHHLLRKRPVRIYWLGAEKWQEMDSWPPPFTETPYFLHPHGALSRTPAAGTHPPSSYLFDPADPTPALGGARFSAGAGPKDQRPVEARPDVLTFTTPPLAHDLDVSGPVRAVLFVRSSRAHTDFVARLCDVSLDGKSINLCDGLFRLTPDNGTPQPDGTLKIEIDLWATANRFLKGHCIRLQVASAGYPRWAPNPGTGESHAVATRFLSAEQHLFHDQSHPSMLLLPVVHGL